MPPQNIVQQCLVDVCLSHELLDPREIFMSPDACSYGDDVLRTKNFRSYAFILDRFCFAHCLLSQSGCSDELNRKVFNEQMLAFDTPAFRLQTRVDLGNSCAQAFVAGDENNVRVIGGNRFGVIDCGQRPAKRTAETSSFAARRTSASGIRKRSSGMIADVSTGLFRQAAETDRLAACAPQKLLR